MAFRWIARRGLRLVGLLLRLLGVGVPAVLAGVPSWRLMSPPTLELARALRSRPQSVQDWTLDHVVADLASALGLAALAGVAVTGGLAVGAGLTARRFPTLAPLCQRLTPRVCRPLVALVCGVGLVSPVTLAGGALADPGTHSEPCQAPCRERGPSFGSTLGGLPYPDLPTAHRDRPSDRPDEQPGTPPVERLIVVRAGDSLWRIAERRLPVGAAASEVAALTWRLYALNRSTIGDDPDLILPGTTLIATEGRS